MDTSTSKPKFQDLYALLGVERNATTKEIESAWRKACHTCHPDKLTQASEEAKAEGAAKFIEYTRAKDTLTDARKRAAHDEEHQQRNKTPLQRYDEAMAEWKRHRYTTGFSPPRPEDFFGPMTVPRSPATGTTSSKRPWAPYQPTTEEYEEFFAPEEPADGYRKPSKSSSSKFASKDKFNRQQQEHQAREAKKAAKAEAVEADEKWKKEIRERTRKGAEVSAKAHAAFLEKMRGGAEGRLARNEPAPGRETSSQGDVLDGRETSMNGENLDGREEFEASPIDFARNEKERPKTRHAASRSTLDSFLAHFPVFASVSTPSTTSGKRKRCDDIGGAATDTNNSDGERGVPYKRVKVDVEGVQPPTEGDWGIFIFAGACFDC